LDRRTGELNGSLSGSARFTLLLTDYWIPHDFRRESAMAIARQCLVDFVRLSISVGRRDSIYAPLFNHSWAT
jgi:hypothetical protein